MQERSIKFIAANLLLAFFALQPLAAQDNPSTTTNHHSLWRIQGHSNVVYLLGSVHVLKPENFPLAAPLEAAFSNAQVAVFETDVIKLEEPQVQIQLMSKAQLPAGETLQQHLSAQTYAAFTNHARQSGLPLELLQSMKPAMAAMMLEIVELTKLGADPANGVDQYFAHRAVKEGKQLIGLETVDFQIDLITGFAPDEDELVMKTSLKDLDKTRQMYGDIIAAWQAGDSAAIEKLLNEALFEAPAIYKRLVADRNKTWVPRIEELLRGGKDAIVIVGAAHLVGAEGVVELLKKKGLKVTQL